MNSIVFERGNGNLTAALPTRDHVSGLIFLGRSIENTLGRNDCASAGSAQDVANPGENADPMLKWQAHQMRRFFAKNPAGLLYSVCADIAAQNGEYSAEDEASWNAVAAGLAVREAALTAQKEASGEIRQFALCDPLGLVTPQTLLSIANDLVSDMRGAHTPAVVLAFPRQGAGLSDITEAARGAQYEGVACVLCADGADAPANPAAGGPQYCAAGTVLAMLSLAAVNQSVSWVQKFPTGLAEPALSDGTLIKFMTSAAKADLDNARVIFPVTYPGLGGSYLSDSRSLTSAGDYRRIEVSRTVDKAVRTVRAALLPFLGSPQLMDAETGELSKPAVDALTAAASLDQMLRDQEISGYNVYIDPAQNILGGAPLRVAIAVVPTATLSEVRVTIGVAASV